MDSVLTTPRLKLTLLRTAARGQPELEWLHELHSDEKTTWWSITGQSKSLEETEKKASNYLPLDSAGNELRYRVAYTVHKLSPTRESDDQSHSSSEFIGLVTLVPIIKDALGLPEHLGVPASAAATTLTIQTAYQFLPKVWGMGYATESVSAVFEACKRSTTFWLPYSKLYVRALVNPGNPPSQRVMDKVGMTRKGVFEWRGEAVFLAGKWRERDDILIYGKYLIE